ncbi:MAG TPA: hypothetical protein VGV89_07250 [Thermoplasmata archaeon]|nr:hypothetical protein [Thermoplasmata archaeon]
MASWDEDLSDSVRSDRAGGRARVGVVVGLVVVLVILAGVAAAVVPLP